MTDKIFFDHASTTPMDKRVFEAMKPAFMEVYGNPSSQIHDQGVKSQKLLENAREQVAALAGARPEEVIFTSGATEANNLALLGIALKKTNERKHILISEVEHFSVLNAMHPLRAHGFEVELVPVDEYGVVTPEALKAKLREDTALVSVVHGNSEIGTVSPIDRLAEIAHEKGALFHTDATASAGLIPIDKTNMQLDAVTLSAHNLYGPKGAGALVVSTERRPSPRTYGGFQEFGIRSGTENVPGIVGFGEAARLAKEEFAHRVEHLQGLGRRLWKGLEEKVRFIHFTGHAEKRLPGHVSFWVEHVEGESLILMLNYQGIMAASGSACSSNLKAKDEDELIASHIQAAVGVPTEICAGSVMMSLGKDNTSEEVEKAIETLPPIVDRLLTMSPSYADYMKSQKA